MSGLTRNEHEDMLIGGKERRLAAEAEAVRQLTLSAVGGLMSAAPAACDIFLDQLGEGKTVLEAMQRVLACLEENEDEISAEVVAAITRLADVRRFAELPEEDKKALDNVAELLSRIDSMRRSA